MSEAMIDELEQWKSCFGSGNSAELERLLIRVRELRLTDTASVTRLHETLLFLRAYPRNAKVARLADAILFSFADRVAELEASGIDLTELANPEVSGIAGTTFSAVFSYDVAQRLAARHGRSLKINWDDYDNPEMGAVISRFIPLLGEDWPVEANVPYRDWVPGDLSWLLNRFKSQAKLYDPMQLPLVWKLGNSRATRSRMRLAGGKLFFHEQPLLRRSDVSIEKELCGPPIPVTRLATAETQKILDLILDTSAVRYRELYGFSHPDSKRVFRADFGRGVQVFVFGVPPESRLPLRAYHSASFFKNGVPIGYVEVLSLFERAEVGFNLYYTFREGESAWLYAKVLRLFHQLLGATCFSVDPYQIGHHNSEAIDSGAFWFYRKLGFRSVVPEIEQLVDREEEKIRKTAGYRTPARTLKRLAEGYMLYESPEAQRGTWDHFHLRTIGFAVARRMMKDFGGEVAKMRHAASQWVTRMLGVKSETDLALALTLIPDIARWTKEEKDAVVAILRAKESADEAKYLRLMQQHEKLRAAFLRLGSV